LIPRSSANTLGEAEDERRHLPRAGRELDAHVLVHVGDAVHAGRLDEA
jgi:hypothetical protein